MARDIPQEITEINRQLKEHFGIDSDDGVSPIWRLVWSEDQYEHRLTNHSREGFELPYPQVRLLPKYKQWINPPCWVLERLVVVPIQNLNELPSQAKSYEPIHPFLNPKTEMPIDPVFRACKFLVDCIYAAQGKRSMAKYVDEEALHPEESRKERIDNLVLELFGDESMLMGRTVTGEAVGFTTSKILTEEKK